MTNARPPASPPSGIRLLPQSLSAQLWAGRNVSTYASAASLLLHSAISAGAREISLSVHPAALRLTCTDDTGQQRPAPKALTGVASVDVVARSTSGAISVLGSASRDDAAALLPRKARGSVTVVDVWELFSALPVRRRAAAEAGDVELLQSVRSRVVAAALAYPYISFTLLSGQGGLPVVETSACASLGLRKISETMGSAIAEQMVQLRCVEGAGYPVRISGFISKDALTFCADEAQAVSIDGVALSPASFLHKAVRAAWKLHNPMRGRPSGPLSSSRRRPAFVLNFFCDSFCADIVFSGDDHADVRFHDPSIVLQCVDLSIAEALQISPKRRRLSVAVEKSLPSSQLVPGRRPSIVKPFRVRKKTFSHASSKLNPEIETALLQLAAPSSSISVIRPRPRTAPPAIISTSFAVRAGVSRGLTEGNAPVLRRPKSAAEIQQGFKASSPSWINPCFESRGTDLAPAVGIPHASCCPANREHVLDMRQVRITRDDICKLRVVGQSDQKFIIVADESSILYAVDQHAASERARFESLLRKLKVESVAPNSRKLVSLTSCQAAALNKYSLYVRRWGWDVMCVGQARHEILSAPQLCGTGLHIDKADHLIAYLDGLASGSAAMSIPRPIMDALANSACHSAVRFGDELSQEQCVAIVKDLEGCEVPFNCAHGRPSIVPLVVL